MSVTAGSRAPSAIVVTLILLGSLVLAATQNGNDPQSNGGPTVEILTPYEILEPSPSNNPAAYASIHTIISS